MAVERLCVGETPSWFTTAERAAAIVWLRNVACMTTVQIAARLRVNVRTVNRYLARSRIEQVRDAA